MLLRIIVIFSLALGLNSCSKKDKLIYEPKEQVNAYKVYEEGLDALERNDFLCK